MNRPSKSRLKAALLPIGVVAAVAGCAGGSAVSSGGSTKYIPPAGPQQMVSAQLLVQIPARSSSSEKRNPKYYSSATQVVTLNYGPSPLPSPLPSPSVFSVPTPGASPTSFPISVQVPTGPDTFVVNTYDGASCCGGPNGYLLTSAQVTQTINPTGAQSIMVTGSGVVNQLNFSPSNGSVLRNQAGDQTRTITLTGRDSANASITGPVAGTITIAPTSDPGGAISASPSAVTSLPATVTITYAHSHNTNASLKASYTGVTSGAGGFLSTTFGVAASTYLWVANSGDHTVQILDGISGALVATVDVGPYGVSAPTLIAVQSSQNGCPGAAGAFVSDGTNAAFITMPTPAPTSGPTSPPSVISAGGLNPLWQKIGAVAFDSSCVAYFGTGYLGGSDQIDVMKLPYGSNLSSGTSIISSATSGPSPTPAPLTPYGTVQAIVANGGNVYAGQQTGNIAKYDGTSATDLGFGYNTTALAPYLTNGFVAAEPTPGPSLAFLAYDGSSLSSPPPPVGSSDVVTQLIPDGNNGFFGALTGGTSIWRWASIAGTPGANAQGGPVSYGIQMVPGSTSYFWVLVDGAPGSIQEYTNFNYTSPLLTMPVGNSPRALGVGP